MAKRPPKSTLKDLKAIWNAKLKKSGFVDIEPIEGRLTSYSRDFARRDDKRYHPDIMETKAAYFRMAEYLLIDFKFKSRREQIIWEYHANGITIRDTVKILRKARIYTSRSAVGVVVKRLKNIMMTMYMGSSAGNG